MNKESANSMLKLLEEPPAGTVLILLTSRISAVLPTIVSRCQIIRFSWLSPAEIREALARRLSLDAGDPRLDEVCDTGSLGLSLYRWSHPSDDARREAEAFLTCALSGDWMAVASFIDEAAQWNDFSRYEQLFTEIAELVRIAFLNELTGTNNVFLPGNRGGVSFPGRISPEKADRLRNLCQKSMDAVKARANMTLVLSNFAIAVREMLHEQKHQTG
jgi:DNA polymerase-3 subunit delta'